MHVVHNWSWEAAVVTAPTDLDVLAAAAPRPPIAADARRRLEAAGDTVTLGAWDVLVAVTR